MSVFRFTLCLILVWTGFASVSNALDSLVTNDGFGLTFGGEKDPRVSGVTIDGTSVSGNAENGGFNLFFVGENSITLESELLVNGDLDNVTGWKMRSHSSHEETGGRNGKGAVCLTRGGRASQTIKFSEGNNKLFGLRISGWSKATDVDKEIGSAYSLYMDVKYTDDSDDYGLTVDYDVGTHDYQYKEMYFEMKKPISSASLYLMYKDSHKTGTVCFDDVSVKPYSVPAVTSGTIKKTSNKHYTQVSTMLDSKLTAEFKAEKTHITINGTLENKKSGTPDRAVTVSFSIPVDTSDGWMWGSGIEVENITEGGAVGAFEISTDSSGLPYTIDRLPVAGISSSKAGIGIGIKLGSVFAYRLTFGGVQKHLTISMEFSLTSLSRIPNSAWFEFVIFKLDAPNKESPFRAAYDKYGKKIFAEPYMNRVILDQGLWMPFDPIEEIEGQEDFAFRFYEGQRKSTLIFDTMNNILNYPYIEPTLVHHDFMAETPAELKEKLKACDTTECAVGLTSYITDENGNPRYYEENADWNTGCRMPVNSHPKTPGSPNMASYILADVDKFYDMETTNITHAGIYVDSLESFGTTRDYRSDLFHLLGVTPIYDGNRRPCTMASTWTFEFMAELAKKLRTEKRSNSTIMANGIYNYFPHMAMYSDVSGMETTWLDSKGYAPLKHKRISYYRFTAFQKPYLFLQNSNFKKWTYDMTQKYMESSLLYGIWPGFFSADAATDRYFDNPDLYNRDRPLFKRYMPFFKTVTKQGWEPLTCVVSTQKTTDDTASFYAERWGGGSGKDVKSGLHFYITARVEGTDSKDVKYNVGVNFACMGAGRFNSKLFTVKEILQKDSTVLDTKNLNFDFSFEKNKTYVFEVTQVITGSESEESFYEGGQTSEESSHKSDTIRMAPIFILAFILALLSF